MSEAQLNFDDLDPIDIVEHIAQGQDWEFNRIDADQITMQVEGQWRYYTITLAWSAADETLRLVCTFDMDPPQERLPDLYAALNSVNEHCWSGFFTFWAKQNMMVHRHGLLLAGGQIPNPDQIDTMICDAILAAERFYPTFQMVTWGNSDLDTAMQAAILDVQGTA